MYEPQTYDILARFIQDYDPNVWIYKHSGASVYTFPVNLFLMARGGYPMSGGRLDVKTKTIFLYPTDRCTLGSAQVGPDEIHRPQYDFVYAVIGELTGLGLRVDFEFDGWKLCPYVSDQ